MLLLFARFCSFSGLIIKMAERFFMKLSITDSKSEWYNFRSTSFDFNMKEKLWYNGISEHEIISLQVTTNN